MPERFRVTERALRRRIEARVERRIGHVSFRPPIEILQNDVPDLTPGKITIATKGLERIQKDLEKLREENFGGRIFPMFQVERGDVTKQITHEVVPCGKEINIFSGFTLISRPMEGPKEFHFSVYRHQTKKGILTNNVWCVEKVLLDSTTWGKVEPGVIFVFKKKPSTYVIREIYELGTKASFSSSSIGEWVKHEVN